MNPQTFGPLVVMGGGTMASAIVRGGLAAGVLQPARTIVCEPDAGRRAAFDAIGVRTTADHAEAIRSGGPILLAVKPQSFPELAGQLRPIVGGTQYLTISILAGTTAASIHAGLGPSGRVVRVMPNTPVSIRRGISAICRGPGASNQDLALAELLFASVGSTVRIDESMMNAATAIGGSGPAYVYYLAEALVAAAQDVGFDSQTADQLVRATIEGAAMLLAASPMISPEQLRAGVTSKGGTTAAASAVLDQACVQAAIRRAVVAARDRGIQLAQVQTPPII